MATGPNATIYVVAAVVWFVIGFSVSISSRGAKIVQGFTVGGVIAVAVALFMVIVPIITTSPPH